MRFTATNALSGSASTSVRVTRNLVDEPAAAEGFARVPTEFALSGAYPNPGVGVVSFSLDLPRESDVDFGIFDLQGRLVAHQQQAESAGRLTLSWSRDARR